MCVCSLSVYSARDIQNLMCTRVMHAYVLPTGLVLLFRRSAPGILRDSCMYPAGTVYLSHDLYCTCRRHSDKPKPQKMGHLPIKCMTPDLLFENVGVDYAGLLK